MSKTEFEPVDSTDPHFRAHFTEPPGLSDLPTLDGIPGVVTQCEEWGTPVSETRSRKAADSGELPSYMVCAKRRFSTRDVFYWLMSMRRTPTVRRERKRASA